jgi:hypothetical protein
MLKLIADLKLTVNRGTKIKVFFESKIGFRGFKCIEIGKKDIQLEEYINAISLIDNELKLLKIIDFIQI